MQDLNQCDYAILGLSLDFNTTTITQNGVSITVSQQYLQTTNIRFATCAATKLEWQGILEVVIYMITRLLIYTVIVIYLPFQFHTTLN